MSMSKTEAGKQFYFTANMQSLQWRKKENERKNPEKKTTPTWKVHDGGNAKKDYTWDMYPLETTLRYNIVPAKVLPLRCKR